MFVFFLLSETIDLSPIFGDKGIDSLDRTSIEFENDSIVCRSDPSLLQVSDIPEDFLDRVTCSISGLVRVVPRESFEDRIEDPRGFDTIDGLGVIVLSSEIAISIENFTSETMECMDRNSIGFLPDHRGEPFSHIACCILGEGETEDIRGEVVCRREDIRDAGSEELCLPTSWPCDHEDRSVDRLDRFELAIIEGCEDRREICNHSLILAKNARKSR